MTTDDRPKVALVTGASRGLGEVVARSLAGAGFSLVIGARGAEALERSAERLRGFGHPVIPVVGAVEDPEVRAALAGAVGRFGHLDVLVNNASELGPPGRPPALAVPTDGWERAYRVNVVAPVALTALLRPALARSTAPLVVNITSDAAVGAYPGWAPYGASKAALDLVSRTLADELRGDRIHVVAVDPGDLRTAMHQAAYLGEDISDRPLPEATVPFWAWLFGQDPASVQGRRFRAQAERWGDPP